VAAGTGKSSTHPTQRHTTGPGHPQAGHTIRINDPRSTGLDGDRVTLPLLRLVEYHGQFLFVGGPRWPDAPRYGYYGPDSVGLGRLLLDAARGRCLGLFSSTGVAQGAVIGTAADESLLVEGDTGLVVCLSFD